MYTLWCPASEAAYIARSRRSRASSTPRLLAASISTTSRLAPPFQIRWQPAHSPQGSPGGSIVALRSQLSAMARIRAAVVFPTPARPRQQVPVADPVAQHRAAEHGGDVILHQQLTEAAGSVAAGECESHGGQGG